MGYHKSSSLLPFLFIFAILFTSSTIQLSAAFRPLHDSNQLLKKYFPNNYLQSFQKGTPVSQPGGSPCTFIPTPGGQCRSLNGKNFAGHANRAPPPPKPDTVVDFSVAVSTK
ncbi:hypothetical protein EZV62_000823 [Acer yangbiense]|uniref:Uncharacterized protein n=1 Tax=Acer yangbiense TaxID=1000413 RepID=A0A5C7ISK3_9ROSI|nr:hypothetical protein EZV62_000810 [Acer yangbiense]TXG72244.1 hypothetical protein EZV62_000823 [Acer yangbiense]